jgi:CheY-like chemotaxis protein
VSETPPLRGKAILVVDDDADLREVLAEIIKDAGRRVLMAKSGLDALSQLDSAPRPCLVLLDLGMRPMSGQEFLEKLRTRPDAADFPVVLTSGTAPIPESCWNAPGVVAVLPKPFDIAALTAVLKKLC